MPVIEAVYDARKGEAAFSNLVADSFLIYYLVILAKATRRKERRKEPR